MDDFWGVIWGATIALVASVVGGLLTSVVGPWLTRRADQADRKQQAAALTRETVRGALRDISIGMNNRINALGAGDEEAGNLAMQAVTEAQITLRLWTTHEEVDIETLVHSVLATGDVNEALIRVATWEEQTALWFRGVLEAKDFESSYDAALEKRAPLAERWRAEQAAAAAEAAARVASASRSEPTLPE